MFSSCFILGEWDEVVSFDLWLDRDKDGEGTAIVLLAGGGLTWISHGRLLANKFKVRLIFYYSRSYFSLSKLDSVC